MKQLKKVKLDEQRMPESVFELARAFPYFVKRHEDFQCDHSLGKGGYGVVYHGIEIKTGTEVAVKELFARKMDGKLEKSFIREVTSLAICDNRFICQLIGFTIEPPYSIVTAFQNNQDLKTNVKLYINKFGFSGYHLCTIALGVCNAVDCIHSLGLVHRDLKTANVLMDDKQVPRLGDFGISRFVFRGSPMTRRIGTPAFMAPEVAKGKTYNQKIDIYGIGVILFEMSECRMPYEGMSRDAILQKLEAEKPDITFTKITPRPLQNLILRCMSHNPEERPTAREVFDQFASGKVVFSKTEDIKRVKKFAQKLLDADQRRRENPPEPPAPTIDVEQYIAKLTGKQANDTAVSNSKKNQYEKKLRPPPFLKCFPFKPKPSILSSDFEIDNSILEDPSNPDFYDHILDSAKNLTDDTSDIFFTSTWVYLSRTIPDDVRNFIIKVYCIAVEHSTRFADTIISNRIVTLIDDTFLKMKFLIKLFQFQPLSITQEIAYYALQEAREYPLLGLEMIAFYAKNLPPMQLSIPVLDCFISFSEFCQKPDFMIKYAQVCIAIINKNRALGVLYSPNFSAYFISMLQNSHKDVVIAGYSALAHLRLENTFIDPNVVAYHMRDPEIAPAALSMLWNAQEVPTSPNLLAALAEQIEHNESACSALMKIAMSSPKAAAEIAGSGIWAAVRSPIARIKLAAVTARFQEALPYLALNSTFFGALTEAAPDPNPELASLIAVLVTRLAGKEFAANIVASGFMDIFLQHLTPEQDQKTAVDIMRMVSAISNYVYVPTVGRLMPTFLEFMRRQNELTSHTIVLLVKMSGHREGAMLLAQAGLTSYFQSLSMMPSYRELAQTFLMNLTRFGINVC